MTLARLRALPLALFLACSLSLPATAQEGVNVGKPSFLSGLVPAGELEQAGAQQYGELKRQAAAKGALAPDDHPQVIRLRQIAKRILPYASRFNDRARGWQWEVNLIGSKQINAFCMPGGKIAFFTGILDQLKLTDDEIAVVMGHEVAHALREHARERLAKGKALDVATQLGEQLFSNSKYGALASLGLRGGATLLNLKFSRGDETEADVVGLDLAARAGYDPRAGITLWRKMGQASQNTQISWLSTHPAGEDRIAEIERHLPEVMPLYERARPSDGR